jgi:RimJ/RimL family protein N-acetyltransferase
MRPRDQAARINSFGFHLRPEYWGRGYATEAGRAVIRHAFTNLSVRALFAGHHPANPASPRVLEKLGFRYTHDELYPPTGLRHRSCLLTAADTAG